MVSIMMYRPDGLERAVGGPVYHGGSTTHIARLVSKDASQLADMVGLTGFQMAAMLVPFAQATIRIVTPVLFRMIGVNLLVDLISIERRKRESRLPGLLIALGARGVHTIEGALC